MILARLAMPYGASLLSMVFCCLLIISVDFEVGRMGIYEALQPLLDCTMSSPKCQLNGKIRQEGSSLQQWLS